jgi:hypothetical protein
MKLSSRCIKQVPQSRGLDQLYFTPPLKHQVSYVGRNETSLRTDIQPPWADVPQSTLGSAKRQHPPKYGTQ